VVTLKAGENGELKDTNISEIC